MTDKKATHLDIAQLENFLASRLPREARRNLHFIVASISDEARKFDARMTTKHLWINYGARRRKLKMLSATSQILSAELGGLDPIAKELLAHRLPSEAIEKAIGMLLDVHMQASRLLKEIPSRGRPTNIAEEAWIMAMADIFETSFARRPSISKAAGPFYDFLQVSKPFRMAREGDLDPRSLRRALKKRDRYLDNKAPSLHEGSMVLNLPPRL